MIKLYFRNRKLGYPVMRLVVAGPMHDVDVAHKRREDRAHMDASAATAAP